MKGIALLASVAVLCTASLAFADEQLTELNTEAPGAVVLEEPTPAASDDAAASDNATPDESSTANDDDASEDHASDDGYLQNEPRSDEDNAPAQSEPLFVLQPHTAEDAVESEVTLRTGRLGPGEVAGTRALAYGVNLRGYVHNVPDFVLDAMLQAHQPHWGDGPRFIFGGEFLVRKNDRTDYIIGIDYSDFRTEDGWWLNSGQPVASTDWVENNMRTLTISFEWNAVANLDRFKRAQIYGGVGIGAAIRLGEFRKYDTPTGCFANNESPSILQGLTPSSPCPALPGSDIVLDGSPNGEERSVHNEKIPRVLPSLIATLGFRYIIADTVSIAIEGGLKTAAFYGGLELGFIVGKRGEPVPRNP